MAIDPNGPTDQATLRRPTDAGFRLSSGLWINGSSQDSETMGEMPEWLIGPDC